MIKTLKSQSFSPTTLLILQGIGFVVLTYFVSEIFSAGNGKLFLAGILGVLGVVGLFNWPYWGVIAILTGWFTGIGMVPKVVGAILLVPLGLTILREREIWVLRIPQIKILLVIGFLFLISMWWSDYWYPITLLPRLDETNEMLREFATRVAFLILFAYFITTRRRIELTAWWIIGLILIAAYTAFFPSFGGSGIAKRAVAAFSLAKNPNRLAHICLFATSLLWFYRSYRPTSHLKSLTLPLMFFLTATALSTGSRSGFLQILILGAFIVKEQQGWSATKRLRSYIFLGALGMLLLVAVPSAQLARMTTFDPGVVAAGQQSLRQRIDRVYATVDMIATNPIFGVGIGNYRWVKQAYYNLSGETNPHNSYLWSFASGGVGVFVSYLLLFYITYCMLRQLEERGPPDLLWLAKGLKVNLILFMVFSAFADFWLSDFPYFIIGLTIAMTYLWKREQRNAELAFASLPRVS